MRHTLRYILFCVLIFSVAATAEAGPLRELINRIFSVNTINCTAHLTTSNGRLPHLAARWSAFTTLRNEWRESPDLVRAEYMESAEKELAIRLKTVSRLLRGHFLDNALYMSQSQAKVNWERANTLALTPEPPSLHALHGILEGTTITTPGTSSQVNWPPQSNSPELALQSAAILFYDIINSRAYQNGNLRLAALAVNSTLQRLSLPPLTITPADLATYLTHQSVSAAKELLIGSMENTINLTDAFLRDAGLIISAQNARSSE